jgi:hypothetical protein
MRKKPVFQKQIVIRKEDNPDGTTYDLIVGDPTHPQSIDAQNGDYVAVYRLVGVHRFETNPRLK